MIVKGILLGLLTGLVCSIFGQGLLWITYLVQQGFPYPLLGLIPIGLLTVWVYRHYSHFSMAEVVRQSREKGELNPLLMPLIFGFTWLAHLVGASVGREGVAVQMGASIGSWLGRRPLWVRMGMAAGFGGLFQTPLAATAFVWEVSGQSQGWIYGLLAAVIASLTSHFTGLEKFSHLVHLSHVSWLGLVAFGLIVGILGASFASLLTCLKKVKAYPFARVVVLGSLVILGLWFTSGRYMGLGTNLIQFAFNGQAIYAWDWLLKALFTLTCLSIGFQGGEVTPLFACGASLGAVLAPFLGMPVLMGAALGYCGFFGGASKTWLAPILIGFEVFGFQIGLLALVTCSVGALVNWNVSIYPNTFGCIMKLKK